MTEWLWHLLDKWEERLLRSPTHSLQSLKPGESVVVVFDKEDKS